MTSKPRHPARYLVQAALWLVLTAAALPGCAIFSPPKPYLPSRSGIQSAGTVTVKPDENIYAIAREHNVSMRDLIVLNNLKPPFDIRAGQTLDLPVGGNGGFAGEMPAPTAAPLSLVEKNDLAPIEPASVAQESLAPIEAPPAAATPVTNMPPPVSSAEGKAAAMSLQPPSPQAKPEPPPATTQAEPVPALNRPAASIKGPPVATTVSDGPALDTTDMVWPVQGPILSAYGSKGAGLNNDGVNIGAPKGSPVVAAAPGTVVYAGNEMKGFGNLVLIRHQGDWVTAYAHLDRVLVKKDSIVDQGDEIGTVGKTGNVTTPQLHFETRHAGKPVDPASIVKSNM